MTKQKPEPVKAVIYCRVSTDKQVREGDGLRSQQTRCEEHARRMGVKVVKVFKDEGVSGSLGPDNRPAAKEMFAFLDTQKEPFYVIVDDLNRVARSHQAHIEFQTKVAIRGAKLASPGHEFKSTPDGLLVTDLLMSVASYQREANKEQVKNRQRARLINGYWVFIQPLGYKYVKDTGGGKVLVRDDPKASVIAEAFQGFASGRFESHTDVAHFLAQSGAFKTGKNGKIHPSIVKAMLSRIMYTGHLEFPEWDVSLREGKHPAIIDMATFAKVQERLGLKAKTPYRKDLREDFPLRGFVLCEACNQPMTSSWSKGRNGRYPYYHCKTQGCGCYGKSIKRDFIEGEFESVLKDMTPSDVVLELAQEIIRDCWAKKKAAHADELSALEREANGVEHDVEGFMERLIETRDHTLIELYERRIKELEMQRRVLAAQARAMSGVDTSFESAVGTVFDFIRNPHGIWVNGDLQDKRLVMKLAFAKKLPFSRENKFGTAAISLPFSVLREMTPVKKEMVEGGGFEPPYSEEGRFTVCCH